jgi:hypothetical protein
VIAHPSRGAARASASGPLAREPVHDGAGRSIEVINQCAPVPLDCDATPQEVATFLGTVAHHDEINLLTVVLTPPAGVALQCGSAAAQACYFPSLQRMVINGNKAPAPDGASWEFVIAHEYGHHLANNRSNPPFDSPAVDWGPKRWASYAKVCPGVRAGRYFPGDEDVYYFQNPGEAFAESFAFNRFPTAPVPWHWTAFPVPDGRAFAAIQRDALDPWAGNEVRRRQGRYGKKRRPRLKVKSFETPSDGMLLVTLRGADRARLSLTLRGSDGELLGRSNGPGSREQVEYLLCGERGVSAFVKRRAGKKTRFRVTALVP